MDMLVLDKKNPAYLMVVAIISEGVKFRFHFSGNTKVPADRREQSRC
jgi:hypothetical protein